MQKEPTDFELECDQTVGAGLLAKAVQQSPDVLNDTPHSRASPLPHFDSVTTSNLSTSPLSDVRLARTCAVLRRCIRRLDG
ncbi:MAG TPA: hypothetical protein DIW86_18380 [Pseudomonas sp.]|nr:hypothetical protein [Pseudomonas sp.]